MSNHAPPVAGRITVPGLTRQQIVGWRNAVFVIFGLTGLGLSSWVSRTPTIRDTLHASTGEMGWIVFCLAVGSIVGLAFSSHVLVVFGPKRTIAVAVTGGSVGLAITGIGVTVFATPPLVCIGLALFGAGTGMCDVAMNVEGAANERVLGRTVMPLFHAAFSVGTVAGAAVGALAELLGVSVAVHFGVIAIIIVVTTSVCIRKLQPHPDEPDTGPAPRDAQSGWRGRLSIWKDRRTILIGLIVLGMAFAEGSANDWLALAMVDGHHVSNAAGAFIFGVFVAAMTVGRVAGVYLLDRFGRVAVLRASAALAAVGLLIVIFVPSAWLAGVGVICWGLGSSLGFPVGMSAAADDPRTAAARVSAVATIGYFAFLVGPPAIGFLGVHFGLLHGLLLVLVLIVLAGVTSGAARKPTRPAGVDRPGVS